MTVSNRKYWFSGVARSEDSNEYTTYQVCSSWAPCHIHTTRWDHPLVRSGGSTPHTNDLTRRRPSRPSLKEKRYPGCLPQAVRGVIYSADANRRQPSVSVVVGLGLSAKYLKARKAVRNLVVHGMFRLKVRSSRFKRPAAPYGMHGSRLYHSELK